MANKRDKVKFHITATIDEKYVQAVNAYRNDPANLIGNEKPSRSAIIQMALECYLVAYLPKE
jgi:hypothetical protein